MKIGYIKENENIKCFKEKINLKTRGFFNIIQIKNIENKTFFILPITSNTKLNKRKIRKLANGIFKKLYMLDIEDIVLSEYLFNIELLKNILYEQKIDILDGKNLFKYLSYNILEYIYKYKKKGIEEVSILVNDLTKKNKQNIIYIATKIKRLNIITNNIDKFKTIENYLYNELGILINISNNKKKSLLKANVILNFDYPNELINKFNINNKAIIINIPDNIKINTKRFDGVLVNNFKINMPIEFKIEGFKDEEIYESMIYNYSYYEAQEKIEKDKIEIKGLIGNRGIILKQEFI